VNGVHQCVLVTTATDAAELNSADKQTYNDKTLIYAANKQQQAGWLCCRAVSAQANQHNGTHLLRADDAQAH
jgi:hypothetical protein